MRHGFAGVAAVALLVAAGVASADEVGRVKVVKGAVTIERAGSRLPATVGMKLEEGDVIATGRDGAAGVTFTDDSLLSIGPDSALAIDRFAFDTTTHAGRFDTPAWVVSDSFADRPADGGRSLGTASAGDRGGGRGGTGRDASASRQSCESSR